jgi:hypothetical protein
MGRVLEFFGTSTSDHDANWNEIVTVQRCPYMGRKCIKTRKSDPDVAIGTCSVIYSDQPAIIGNYILDSREMKNEQSTTFPLLKINLVLSVPC